MLNFKPVLEVLEDMNDILPQHKIKKIQCCANSDGGSPILEYETIVS